MAVEASEIPYVRKDDTFKIWRERTNQMIQQQNNFIKLQEFQMLGMSDEFVNAALQMNLISEND